MDRLTQKNRNHVILNDGDTYTEALKKLAEYEDLEEQGRLIKLPCKVWDTVYIVDGEAILEETVLGFSTSNTKSGETITTMTASYGVYYIKPNINDLGVLHGGNQLSFFFTREEAEAALEKLKGE